ncbi:WD40-repeat-containing domain protein [Scheffersomyces coipomensis]|uniref:WD40-repeat-containing domain protein n=1 Tax=Scheffersomyces coipomensis TaxID=1788519 RepID=UPI00315D0E2B
MDRQALLEEKRRRVQQLRQKRIESKDGDTGSNDVSSVDHIIGSLLNTPEPRKQVSIGIQVDSDNLNQQIGDVSILSIEKEHELTTYDKAVQTIDIGAPVENEEKVIDHKIETSVEEEDPQVPNDDGEPFVEQDLNNSLMESLKLINKVHITGHFDSNDYMYNKSKKEDTESKVTSNVPLSKITSFDIPEASTITAVDTSPHDSKLVAIAYTNEKSKSNHNTIPNGRAIIYSTTKDHNQAFPEYYLSCSSPIHCIQFDKAKPTRIIGGLADGKLVIWDFSSSSSKVVLNPILTTPNYSSIVLSESKSSQQTNYQAHTLSINTVHQIKIDSNDCILSFSEDGIINTWSSNLLAMPKFDSIEIYEPSIQEEYSNPKKTLLSISNSFLVGENNYLLGDSKTFPFLENLILFNDWGVYRINVSDSNEVSTTLYPLDKLSVPNKLFDSSIMSCSNGNSYIISSFLDWSLKIWEVNNLEKQVVSIYTPSIVTNLIVSPTHQAQLITATSIKGVPALQFWDLHKKLFGPLFEIEVGKEGDIITSLSFTADGACLYVGFNHGSTAVWKIEDFVWSKANTLDELDNGLIEYVNKKKLTN